MLEPKKVDRIERISSRIKGIAAISENLIQGGSEAKKIAEIAAKAIRDIKIAFKSFSTAIPIPAKAKMKPTQ
ncbi:hypothetical protein [Ferroglobus sp.]|uniref:hypothetical protein n=1 Tax=Ferroglobus sp. TaxID=2614230 RepID=UPI0025BB029C|nr:hypothetical protein [Ferroglobus sp.]